MSRDTIIMVLVGACLVAISVLTVFSAAYVDMGKSFHDCKAEREQIFECLGNLAEARKVTDPEQCRCSCVYGVVDGTWAYDSCSVTKKREDNK